MKYLFRDETALQSIAAWADEIRVERPYTTPWHYINIPPSAEGVDWKPDCPEGNCITVKIREFAGVVRLAIKTREERQEALQFLVHLVGDLHQPLNAGFLQDHGGNDTTVKFDGGELTLHEFWDGALIGHKGETPEDVANALNAAAERIEKTTQVLNRAKDLDSQWSEVESAGSTERVYVSNIRGMLDHRDLQTNLLMDLSSAVPKPQKPVLEGLQLIGKDTEQGKRLIKQVPRDKREQITVQSVAMQYHPTIASALGMPAQPGSGAQPDDPYGGGGPREQPPAGRSEGGFGRNPDSGYIDPGSFEEEDADLRSADPLGFYDLRPYTERLAEAELKTGQGEAMVIGRAAIEGRPCQLSVMDFEFMGG